MRILISGGLGFVGRNLSRVLIERNHEVEIVDSCVEGSGARQLNDLPRNLSRLLSNAKIHIRDIRSMESAFFKQFDVVIHLAAVVGGRLTIENKPLVVAEDLVIDSKVVSEWGLGNIKHLIYASSSAAYPIRLQKEPGVKLKESDINLDEDLGKPDLTYGWSKLTGEFLLHIGKKPGLGKVTVIRPFSGYGVDQDIAYPFASILRRVLKSSADNSVFQVWGTGLQERDFVYIEDVVAFMCLISETGLEGTFNIATGVGTNFLSLAKLLLTEYGIDEPLITGQSHMPEGVFSRVGDPVEYFRSLDLANLPRPRELSQVVLEEFEAWVNYVHANG